MTNEIATREPPVTYRPFLGPDRWVPIPGEEGYEVSDLGNVRSLDRAITMKNGVVRLCRGRVLRIQLGKSAHSRPTVALGRDKKVKVHILVAKAFLGPRPFGMDVCHENGDRLDNRPDNLRYDTHSANMNDMLDHGTCHNSNKTHCPRGHRLEFPNLRKASSSRGYRSCLACHRASRYIDYHNLPASKIKEVSDRYFESLWKEER